MVVRGPAAGNAATRADNALRELRDFKRRSATPLQEASIAAFWPMLCKSSRANMNIAANSNFVRHNGAYSQDCACRGKATAKRADAQHSLCARRRHVAGKTLRSMARAVSEDTHHSENSCHPFH
jgi:hypothetical protein